MLFHVIYHGKRKIFETKPPALEFGEKVLRHHDIKNDKILIEKHTRTHGKKPRSEVYQMVLRVGKAHTLYYKFQKTELIIG